MAVQEPLAAEISRLLECPYPASLKRLDSLLSECSEIEIQTWANLHSCRVKSLASIVLQSFRAWKYILRIISHLCCSKALREAFLEADPYLLDNLLTEANSNPAEAADSDVLQTSIALLSHPLPAGIPLPASAQAFFMRIVERAVTSPTASMLRPVYHLLEGACWELLGIIPEATLNSFAADIFKILRSITSVEGEPLYLICLGILRTLSGLPPMRDLDVQNPLEAHITCQQDSHSFVQQQGLESARSYFIGSKAAKTLQLVALQVMWVYKIEDSRGVQSTLADLELAISIVSTLDKAIRTEWCKINTPTVRKILEKATKGHLTADLKIAGLVFTGSLVADPSTLPSTTRSIAAETLLGCLKTRSQADKYRDTIRLYLGLYSAVLTSQQVGSLLVRSMDACTNTSAVSLSELRALAILLQQLSIRCRVCKSLRRAFMVALDPLDAHDLKRRIQDLAMRLEKGTIRTRPIDGACERDVSDASFNLAVAVQHLLTGLMLIEGKQEFCISGSDGFKLLYAGNSATLSLPPCGHLSSRPRCSDGLRNTTDDPDWSSHTWTSQLNEVLHSDLRNRQVSIVRLVNEVCGDLQNRCDEVEKPLRDARSRNDDLEAKCAALETRLQTTQNMLSEKQRQNDLQKKDEGALAAQLSKAESTTNSLLARVEELEASLVEAQEAAKSELQALRTEHDAVELSHQGELAATIEEMESLQEQVELQNRKIALANDEANGLAAQLDIEQNSRAALAEELAMKQREVDASEKERQCGSYQLSESRDAGLSLTARIVELEDEVEKKNVRIDTLNVQLAREKTTAATNLEMVQAAQMEAIGLLKVANQDAERQHCAELDSLRAEVEAEQLSHHTTQERLRGTTAELQESLDTVKQLERDLEGSNAALLEAQDMRKRLMQAMGLKDEPMAPAITGHRRSRRIGSDRAPTVQEPTGLQGPSTGQSSFESGASSSGGPTPKRSKPRTSFFVPSLHKSQHTKVPLSAAKRASMSIRARQPLQDTPARGNARIRSPEKSIEKPRSGNEAFVESKGLDLNAADLDFDASDLFTSTPFIPDVVSDGNTNLETYDETTADF